MKSGVWTRSTRACRPRFVLALAISAAAWSLTGFVRGAKKPPAPIGGIEWVAVRRVDLDTTILAGGDLHPTRQTMVACRVEDIDDSEGTMILSVIENGARVKKGDELCRLDSSLLEELARHQAIAVNGARAMCLRAALQLENARMALREYQEGIVAQLTSEFEGRIALGRSDTERQSDRVAWTEAMFANGYISKSQLATERQALARARHELRRAEGEFQVFREFQVPREVRALGSEIETARINHHVEADRLKAEEDRLAYLRKQIENCTVRAPQDGVVVYAYGNRWWSLPLGPGVWVDQDEVLFYLPDLSEMEVEVAVHETMGARVRVGMKAGVRIPALADRVFPGRVSAIDPFPLTNWKEWGNLQKQFRVHVRLDNTPRGLLPLMSAVVVFDTGRIPSALVIPSEAISVVDGQEWCYVVAPEGLRRRDIRTGQATIDLVQVTAGLNEGERVVARAFDVE
jgi:HlyD family secretion protein